MHAAFGVVVIVLVYVSGARFYAADTTPVVEKHTVTGTIETMQQLPIIPKALVHRGVGYNYGIRLDGAENFIFVKDTKPRIIGSEILLERLRREDGFDEYRILSD